jgi:hypothetical protein
MSTASDLLAWWHSQNILSAMPYNMAITYTSIWAISGSSIAAMEGCQAGTPAQTPCATALMVHRYWARNPPSMTNSVPVINDASSEARNSTP